MSEPRQVATLRNWYVADYGDHRRLCGQVYGHPRFEDGDPVTTSVLLEGPKGGKAKTRNTDYTLDGPPRFSQTWPEEDAEA